VAAPWQLNTQVSLRDEAFGALAYHHGTRRLVFLKSRELVALVRELSDFDCANDALAALVATNEYDRYVAALDSLRRSEILSARE
jgi:putative mycofactocin binding protein MftB